MKVGKCPIPFCSQKNAHKTPSRHASLLVVNVAYDGCDGHFQLNAKNEKVIKVEIRIDTKKDSAEDIKKTIEFLKSLINASSGSGDFNTSSDAASGMVGLFGDTPVLSNDAPKASDGEEDEEEEKEKIEIIPY